MAEKNRGFSQIRNQFFGQQSIFLQIDYSTPKYFVKHYVIQEGIAVLQVRA